MTTQRQFTGLLRPYRGRDDLFVRGYEVYLVPIDHVVRGFSIYRTGEADRFDIATFVGTSFDSTSPLPQALSQVHRYENWLPRWTQPNLQQEFERTIGEYILPLLKRVDLAAFLPRPDKNWQGPEVFLAEALHMPHVRAPLYAAFGEFDAAEQQFDVLARIPRGHRVMEPILKTLLDDLRPLIRAKDRAGVAALLHSWEAEAMARWRLADHWRPTPFPLECAAT